MAFCLFTLRINLHYLSKLALCAFRRARAICYSRLCARVPASYHEIHADKPLPPQLPSPRLCCRTTTPPPPPPSLHHHHHHHHHHHTPTTTIVTTATSPRAPSAAFFPYSSSVSTGFFPNPNPLLRAPCCQSPDQPTNQPFPTPTTVRRWVCVWSTESLGEVSAAVRQRPHGREGCPGVHEVPRRHGGVG